MKTHSLSPYKARYPAIAIWWVPAKLKAEEIVKNSFLNKKTNKPYIMLFQVGIKTKTERQVQ